MFRFNDVRNKTAWLLLVATQLREEHPIREGAMEEAIRAFRVARGYGPVDARERRRQERGAKAS